MRDMRKFVSPPSLAHKKSKKKPFDEDKEAEEDMNSNSLAEKSDNNKKTKSDNV